ncbi:hypothetical protein GAYE_SCF06G2694 [Galdieria yellowstonensis]|uniref:Alpha-1,6-mannosyl-glycoprotein 2-beta-N-acetylglucosaminyltransferase n=1 Tax=Galdieria yellowstonensis TaxID=3028027 RepID=A0AAV9IBX7_9RHOD|nr:hypothetical protein GAYE_SCF06G2694 [Galdieria yellowstonensis]
MAWLRKSPKTYYPLLLIVSAFLILRYNSLVTKKESFQPRSRDETHSIAVFDSLNNSFYEYFENFHLKYDISKGRHNQRQLSLYHSGKNGENPIPIVLLVGDRVQYIQTTLEKLYEAEGIQDAPIFISRTSRNQNVTELCNRFSLSHSKFVLFFPFDFEESIHPRFRLKVHWLWILYHLFESLKSHACFSHILVLEDDLIVSPDFYTTGLSLIEICRKLQKKGIPIYNVNLYNGINPTCSLNAVEIVSHFDSLGYLISRETFEEIWKHLDIFMSCNDGWDHSVRLLQVLGMIPRYNLQPCISRTRHIGEFGMHVVRCSSIKPNSVKYCCQNPLQYKELNYAAVKISNGSKVNWKEFELLKYDTRDEEFYSKCYDPQNFSGITGPFISQKLDPSLIS